MLRDDEDAGDAFQATFLVLVRRAGSLWVDDSIGPWLHRVAFRTAIHAKKARNRRREAERRLARSLAMQGKLVEAAELAGRGKDAENDPNSDQWAVVYNAIGDEFLLRTKPSQAAEWYGKASRAAKRPVDVYLARVGAGLAAGFQGKTETTVKELEAAANAPGVAEDDREFARTLLNDYLKAAKQCADLDSQVSHRVMG